MVKNAKNPKYWSKSNMIGVFTINKGKDIIKRFVLQYLITFY